MNIVMDAIAAAENKKSSDEWNSYWITQYIICKFFGRKYKKLCKHVGEGIAECCGLRFRDGRNGGEWSRTKLKVEIGGYFQTCYNAADVGNALMRQHLD